LKCQLIEEKEANLKKLTEIEQRSGEKINDLTQKLKESSEERVKIQNESDRRLESVKFDYDALFKEQNDKIKSLQDEKNSLVDKHKKEVDDLHRVIDELRKEKCELIEENRIKTQTLEQENQNYLNDLQNLRNYVNDSMPTIETIKEMTKEREQYEQQILKIKAKNDLLIKENTSLQIRLKSINEILTIQENQLELAKSSSNVETLSSNEKKRGGLLNKWRNKVFELLIQLKTQEIDYKQEQNSSEKKCQEYAQRLDDQMSKNRILENVIEDKKAELNVLTNDNTILNEQVSTLKETNENLEKRRKEDLETTSQLKSFVDSLIKQYQTIEESFRAANKKLVHIDQRVEFAKNRLGVVKALYSRKESKLKEEQARKCNMLDMTTNLSSIHASIQSNESNNVPHNPLSLELPNSMLDFLENKKTLEEKENDGENTLLIKSELEKVLLERDLLAKKLQTDIEEMGEKASKMKDDYELTLKNLNEIIKDLREVNDKKQIEIEDLNENVKVKEHMYDELNKKYCEMETQFVELKSKMSVEIERKCKEREMQFIEKLSKMDQKLNEARREQAKAVVIMRQMERSTNREKERMESMLKSCDNYYKEHLNKLQSKIISLEKERNTLMSTLKQQSQFSSVENRLNDLKNSNNNKITIEDEFHSKPMSSRSRLKSPQEFQMANTSDPELNKWLNRIKSLNDSNESVNESSLKVNLQQKAANGEMTSFWLESSSHTQEFSLNQTANPNELKHADSHQSDFSSHEPIEEQEQEYEEEEAREEDYVGDASSLKNNEIMKQIRKIMGNLELSDNDDEDDEQSEHEVDNAQQCDESPSINEPANERKYEFEHAIDDLFQRKMNSFSN
jgi:coiled-coil alpha-helical rod protein 1